MFFLHSVRSARRWTGLIAVGLAATGSYACARMPGVRQDLTQKSLADDPGVPKVIVRSYTGAPTTTVIGWSTNEAYQGLRALVRSDGSLAAEHSVFVSGFAVPNTASLAYRNSNWYAFANGMRDKVQLQEHGGMRDPFNCDGTDACSPLVIYTARIPDAFLRTSRDSLVVKMEEVNGMSETFMTLRPDMIARYLAVVDSVSAVRRRAVATR